MVETALVLPIILMLCFGIIEYGYRFMKQSQLNNYSYIAARHYSIKDTAPADIQQKLLDAKPADPAPPATLVQTKVCPPNPTGSENAEVEIKADWPSVTGILDYLPGIENDYYALGVARCDG